MRMRQIKTFLMLVALVITMAALPTRSVAAAELVQPLGIWPTVVTTVELGVDAPLVTVSIKAADLVNIEVDNKLLQQIPCNLGEVVGVAPLQPVKLIDMNFDGYLDLQIVRAVGNANVYYDCWLWDQGQQRFVFHDQLSQLSLPVFDAGQQLITTFERSSAAEYTAAEYVLKNNNLVLRRWTEAYYDQDQAAQIVEIYRAADDETLTLWRRTAVRDGEEVELLPFPNAVECVAVEGLRLLVPEGVAVTDTTAGARLEGRSWVVWLKPLTSAVEALAAPKTQDLIEASAIAQVPFRVSDFMWIAEREETQLGEYPVYRRQFTATIDGHRVELGELYYANVNDRHVQIISTQSAGLGDGIILLTKMLHTLQVTAP